MLKGNVSYNNVIKAADDSLRGEWCASAIDPASVSIIGNSIALTEGKPVSLQLSARPLNGFALLILTRNNHVEYVKEVFIPEMLLPEHEVPMIVGIERPNYRPSFPVAKVTSAVLYPETENGFSSTGVVLGDEGQTQND